MPNLYPTSGPAEICFLTYERAHSLYAFLKLTKGDQLEALYRLVDQEFPNLEIRKDHETNPVPVPMGHPLCVISAAEKEEAQRLATMRRLLQTLHDPDISGLMVPVMVNPAIRRGAGSAL